MKMKEIKLLLTALLFTSLVQLSAQYLINQGKSLDRKGTPSQQPPPIYAHFISLIYYILFKLKR